MEVAASAAEAPRRRGVGSEEVAAMTMAAATSGRANLATAAAAAGGSGGSEATVAVVAMAATRGSRDADGGGGWQAPLWWRLPRCRPWMRESTVASDG